MSDFRQADELLIRIYSIDYLLRCKLDEASEKIIKLSPLSGKVDMFMDHDPVVILHNDQKQLHTMPADVAEINKSLGQVTFVHPEKHVEDERRIFERYPVSLIVSARRKYSSKRLHLIAKNISLYGMCVVSESEFDSNELIDIDLITDKNMFYFSGMVVWKAPLGKGFEYGLQLTHVDVATKTSFQSYLENQNKDYMKLLLKAR